MILCVGETLEQRKANRTQALLEEQLSLGLAEVPIDSVPRISLAYGPVWAIGQNGHHATPQQAEDTHAILRARFATLFGAAAAEAVTIHYGGSVEPDNAAAFLSRSGVDGALIGGASLKADPFLAIIRAAKADS